MYGWHVFVGLCIGSKLNINIKLCCKRVDEINEEKCMGLIIKMKLKVKTLEKNLVQFAAEIESGPAMPRLYRSCNYMNIHLI